MANEVDSTVGSLLLCQLEEVEVLRSMYPGEGELILDEPCVLTDIKKYLDGLREAKPGQISYTIRLQVTDVTDQEHVLEVMCSLPHKYPQSAPGIFVTSETLNRTQQKQLNAAVGEYIEELPQGEVCITSVLIWLQDNSGHFLHLSQIEDAEKSKATCTKTQKSKWSTLSRLWIYSHHIYRKELLKKIPESALELDLTGFALPGKPGIICVEGYKENCDEYWQRLKYPNWKHISCKHREDTDLNPEDTPSEQLSKFKLFKDFEVLAFEAHGDYGLRNDYHMDLGQFRQFLTEHHCDYMFHIFFGLQGKEAVKS